MPFRKLKISDCDFLIIKDTDTPVIKTGIADSTVKISTSNLTSFALKDIRTAVMIIAQIIMTAKMHLAKVDTFIL